MNHKRDSLSEAIKRALGLTVSLTTLTGGALAVAQDDEEVLTTEEVLVTGSRIKRADLDNANPVTVVTRDEMMMTGMTDVGDLIQRLPSMSGSPIGTTTNNGGNGSVTIDLRGLGAGRTLNRSYRFFTYSVKREARHSVSLICSFNQGYLYSWDHALKTDMASTPVKKPVVHVE
jgi:outer membrane receptor protein involved in Fe transport